MIPVHFGSFSSTNVLGAPFDQLTGYSIISALCYLTRGKRTSDPRDLLHALIGLLETICSAQQLPWQRIVPGYSRPAEDVLTELSVNIINESKWLGLFSMTWQSPAESSRIQLPSWAMKWSNERPWPLIDGVTIVVFKRSAHPRFNRRGVNWPSWRIRRLTQILRVLR